MLSKMKTGILLSILLFISGCSDSVVILFHKNVDLEEKAELEIAEVLKGIAVVDGFYWHKRIEKTANAPMKVTVELNADESNINYSVEQVSKILKEELAFQEKEVAIKVLVTEENEKLLDFIGYENGQEVIAYMDWDKAETDVFYTEKESKKYGRVYADRDFHCAISVPLKNKVPMFTYSYNVDESKSALLSLLYKDMTFEIKNKKEFIGLPIDADFFKIKLLERYSSENMFNHVYLMFEDLGEINNQPNVPFQEISAPKGMDKAGCEKLLLERSNSTLNGLLGGVSAVNNVVTVGLR